MRAYFARRSRGPEPYAGPSLDRLAVTLGGLTVPRFPNVTNVTTLITGSRKIVSVFRSVVTLAQLVTLGFFAGQRRSQCHHFSWPLPNVTTPGLVTLGNLVTLGTAHAFLAAARRTLIGVILR